MTETLTIRLPAALVRELRAKTNPSAVLRQAASNYVRQFKPNINPMQNHILARAGTWDGDISGLELLKRTSP